MLLGLLAMGQQFGFAKKKRKEKNIQIISNSFLVMLNKEITLINANPQKTQNQCFFMSESKKLGQKYPNMAQPHRSSPLLSACLRPGHLLQGLRQTPLRLRGLREDLLQPGAAKQRWGIFDQVQDQNTFFGECTTTGVEKKKQAWILGLLDSQKETRAVL